MSKEGLSTEQKEMKNANDNLSVPNKTYRNMMTLKPSSLTDDDEGSVRTQYMLNQNFNIEESHLKTKMSESLTTPTIDITRVEASSPTADEELVSNKSNTLSPHNLAVGSRPKTPKDPDDGCKPRIWKGRYQPLSDDDRAIKPCGQTLESNMVKQYTKTDDGVREKRMESKEKECGLKAKVTANTEIIQSQGIERINQVGEGYDEYSHELRPILQEIYKGYVQRLGKKNKLTQAVSQKYNL